MKLKLKCRHPQRISRRKMQRFLGSAMLPCLIKQSCTALSHKDVSAVLPAESRTTLFAKRLLLLSWIASSWLLQANVILKQLPNSLLGAQIPLSISMGTQLITIVSNADIELGHIGLWGKGK